MWNISRPDQIRLAWGHGPPDDTYERLAMLSKWSSFLAACLLQGCVPRLQDEAKSGTSNVWWLIDAENARHEDPLSTTNFARVAGAIIAIQKLLELDFPKHIDGLVPDLVIEWAIAKDLCGSRSTLRRLVRPSRPLAVLTRRDGQPKQTGNHFSSSRKRILDAAKKRLHAIHSERCPRLELPHDAKLSDLRRQCGPECSFEITGSQLADEIEDLRGTKDLNLPDGNVRGFSHQAILNVVRMNFK